MTTDLVPDELGKRIAPLLPKRPARRKRHPGRLPVPDRVALAGIIYALRKGVPWRDVPSEVVGCSGVTAWRRLRDWTEAGVWPRLHEALLTEPRAAGSLDMDDAAIDGSHIRALKGGSCRAVAGGSRPPRLQAPCDRRSSRHSARCIPDRRKSA